MRAAFSILLLWTFAARGQQVVAPTPATVGTTRGEDYHGYNIIQSFETGYRFSDIHGNLGKYRSDVNYRNGVRLLASQLTVNSKSGHGSYFDEIVLTTQGLGNDPYESAVFRVQKNRLYRYDLMWRMNEYYNPGLAIAGGSHLMDTRRRLQDHDFTLLPQSKIQFRVGYTRNSQDGPALTTVNLFDGQRGDEFTPFAGVRRLRREIRVGGDIEVFGVKVNWLRAWDNFKEDTAYSLLAPSSGANPDDPTVLNSFRRVEPYHGNTPLWRVNLRAERKAWAANGRFTYAGGRRNFIFDESAIGIGRFGSAANRQILVTGNARRPVTAGDLSFAILPSDRLTITNNTSAHSTRIDGDSAYLEVNNQVPRDQLLYFRFLGILTITNSTDLNYRVSKALGVYGGYHFSKRRIRSVESFNVPPFGGDTERVGQDNRIHSGLFGIRLKPAKPLTLIADAEIARADRPFTPISEKNFHAIGARAQYKAKTLLLSAAYRQNYNTNSVSLSTHSSRGRNYSLDASWVPREWFAIDASYSKLHLDTVSGLAFFAASQLIEGLQSIYISNIHSANLGTRFTIGKSVDFYVGYAINLDAGDGRTVPRPLFSQTLNAATLLEPVRTFPLRYESPLARVSVRIHPRIRWNFGWQFYRYREDSPIIIPLQNYRAHTGYTSLLWSF